jgi:ketosteroid isomerase-like protein
VSEADIEVVREQFQAVNDRDWERAMDLYADDVVFSTEWGPNSGTYEGKEAVGEWFGDFFRMFAPGYRFEFKELRAIGDAVFLHASHGGSGRTSGAEVSGENSYLYWVRDGKIARVQMFATREEALDAAGSPE